MLHRFLKSRASKSRRAITLIEVLLSIAIGVGIIITAVLLYYTAFGSSRLNQAFSQINAISSGVRNLYSAQSGYGDDTDITEHAIAAKIIENSWIEGTSVVNPWGGEVIITGNGRTFLIEFQEVPQEACAKLIAMDSTGFGGAIRSVEVNDEELDTPVTVAIATTACSETDTEGNKIVWELR